jgi:hypothetical protein
MSTQDLSDEFESRTAPPRPDTTQHYDDPMTNAQIAADEYETEASAENADAGDIGEEQLPASAEAGSKTDKQVWNYSADRPAYGSSLGRWFRGLFKGQ